MAAIHMMMTLISREKKAGKCKEHFHAMLSLLTRLCHSYFAVCNNLFLKQLYSTLLGEIVL